MIPNAGAPWQDFDSASYEYANYRSVRDDDRQIIELTRDHFAASGVRGGRGIDIGSGANLYPAMAMLPFCRRLDLVEYAAPNLDWLNDQVRGYNPHWDNFWAVYCHERAYRRIMDPRAELRAKARVRAGNIFGLDKAAWDIGTMFFVACGISGDVTEFRDAVEGFLRSLRPGAPFAAAFMLNSAGYDVNGVSFPAVAISAIDVSRSMATFAYDVRSYPIETGTPLRSGYEGMLLTLGKAGPAT